MDAQFQVPREMSYERFRHDREVWCPMVSRIFETGDLDRLWELVEMGHMVDDPAARLFMREIWGDLPDLLSKSYERGHPSLLMAAIVGHAEAVDLLVGLGAPLDVTHDGWTPLLFAALLNHPEVVKRLLHYGVDIRTTDNNELDETALCLTLSTEVVQLLIAAGSPVNNKDEEGRTPLFRANTGNIQLLLAAGANPNTQDCNGDTPLHLAVRRRWPDRVRALAPVTDLNLVSTN